MPLADPVNPDSPPGRRPHPLRAFGRRLLAAACAVLGAGVVQAQVVRLGGTGSAIGTMQRLGEAYRKVDPAFRLEIVPNLGSAGGITALTAGSVQIAVTSRALKPEESAAGLQAIEYGRTAFVLATAKPGLTGLSLAEVAELYAGRRTQWADGTLVRLVLRPASDGDSALLAGFSPAVKAALALAQAREGMVIGMTDQDSVDAIERLPGGLGTASLALLLSEQRRALPIALDGIAPTPDNMASGRYPHLKPMFLVLRPDAPPGARQFAQFVDSPTGRQILATLGHLAPGRPAGAPPPVGPR